MLLGKADRDRFAEYLKKEAENADGIAEQLLKLPAGPQIMGPLADREKQYAKACRLISDRLKRTEDG